MEVWIDRIEVWLERFKVIAIDYLTQNQLLYLLDLEYYTGLWDKYFTMEGFITGLIFVALVFFACESGEKASFFKIIAFIAVINSCSVVTDYIYRLTNRYGAPLFLPLMSFVKADNVLSGFLLTLTVVSCFHGSGGRAFLFGVATFAALPLMNYSTVIADSYRIDRAAIYFISLMNIVVLVLIMGILCAVMSGQTYFYVSWLWYGGCSILLKAAVCLLLTAFNGRGLELPGLDVLGKFLLQFTPEYILFVVVLGFAILFERLVIKKPGPKKAAAK